MRNRWVTMILILSLAMNAAFLAVAGYGWYYNNRRPAAGAGHAPESARHFYETLGLTPAQVTRISPMATSFHRRFESLHAEMDAKKDAMLGLLSGEPDESARIEALRREMAGIQDEIQKTVIAHVRDVEAILDADQRQRFFDLLRRSMFQEHGMFVSTGEK